MPAKKKSTKKKPATKTSIKKKSSAKKKPAKKVTKKKVNKKTPKKTPSKMQEVHESVKMPAVCQSCNALPVGSMELVSLLLVVTFSLSAILLTSVYAMEQQADRIDNLESQVQYYQTLE